MRVSKKAEGGKENRDHRPDRRITAFGINASLDHSKGKELMLVKKQSTWEKKQRLGGVRGKKSVQGVECCYEFALYLKLLFSLDLSYEIFQGKVM